MIPILENIITINVFRAIGDAIVNLIRKDASEGTMQNGTDTYSRWYEYNKRNWAYEYEGQRSNYTTNVNMELTGALMDSLDVQEVSPTTMKIGYSSKADNERKLRMNKEWGRDILTLSDMNIEKVENVLHPIIERQLQEAVNEDIFIKIGVGSA